MGSSLNLEDLLEQSPKDIFQQGASEERCISGRFKMSWNQPNNKIEVLASVSPSNLKGRDDHTFKICFQSDAEYIKMLDFAPNDEFRLSLKGVEVKKLPDIPKLSTLPMHLVFSKGLHISWKRQGPNEARKTINTWSSNDAQASDSWFFSRDENDDASSVSRHKRNQSEVEQDELQENPREVKKRQRMDAKRMKKIANTPLSISNPVLSTVVESRASSSEAKPKETDRSIAIQNANAQILHASLLRSDTDIYTALGNIEGERTVTLIGVVVQMSSPKMSNSGDWMRYLDLVDPSNYYTHRSGFKVNCFTKRHKEWLPHPEEGDVLVLRNVKIKNYHGSLSGVGYADKIQWAAFSPTNGVFHHGPPNSAPKDSGLGDGDSGGIFSPFWQPGPLQTTHCVKLSDWWRNLATQAHTTAKSNPGSKRRIHRLISETGPTVPPDGYFDCTVEVLKGYRNSNDTVYTVYVTDYTRNEQMSGVQSAWCPPLLSDFVAQFEMWDEAAVVAESMRPGEYYSIKNARMMTNGNGYPEGKVRENKIVKLAEGDTVNPQLQALLERKRQWEVKKRTAESDIRHQLIQDVEEGKFFHCTVEVLHVDLVSKNRPCIYVTDYTPNPRLASASLPGLRALQGRIVKIVLSGEQQEMAKVLSTGSYYCIRKLRMKHSSLEDHFCGLLGGTEKLVIQLSANNLANENINGLLRRRETWQRHLGQILPDEREVGLLRAREANQSFRLIKDVISADSHLARYSVRARPVDFYPLDLQDAFYQRCTRCNIEIPKTAKACFKCSDFEHEHVQYFYQLYLLVKDQDDSELIVSIDDQCPLLKQLKRSCLQEDRTALRQIRDRVEPIIGKLTMMHDALKAGKRIKVDTALFCFDIEGWRVAGSRKAFRLIEYKSLDS
ncbi:hypothetical protein HYPSUDRAFT_89942 [Hypholoma sublateritium FD-334 SS-4]|uniref:Protection of telomeres protein 1 n=1 Tax=Hypholoma sublateritium (strain FD-334 SS-4) TaxID=945553 RepID=A0A0D2NPA2_HYPSF|nr:hypothetical protein HYPSUDRAFT_89942 [Hypholoma sublateritium FD-334 SS-4]